MSSMHTDLETIEALRSRGWRGGIIPQHRAFTRLRLRPGRLVGDVFLVLTLSLAWIVLLPQVGELWQRMFVWCSNFVGLHAGVATVHKAWGQHISLDVPYLTVPGASPGAATWWITAFVTTLVFAWSFYISEEHLPWRYLARGLAILQYTALAYFAVAAARFPHDLSGYTVGMLVFGSLLIGLIPLVLGLTYFVFDFSLAQKVALAVLSMAHLTLLMPLQYFLHAYVLHESILFMPLLYFAFGPFLDVLIFISFYSWGMSW
jgi:hypothetical protein